MPLDSEHRPNPENLSLEKLSPELMAQVPQALAYPVIRKLRVLPVKILDTPPTSTKIPLPSCLPSGQRGTRETRPPPQPTSSASPSPRPIKASNEARYARKASWFGVRAQATHSGAIRDQCS